MDIAAHLAFLLIFVEGLTVLFFPGLIKEIIALSSQKLLRGAAVVEVLVSIILFVIYSRG